MKIAASAAWHRWRVRVSANNGAKNNENEEINEKAKVMKIMARKLSKSINRSNENNSGENGERRISGYLKSVM